MREILDTQIPPPQGRVNPRVVKVSHKEATSSQSRHSTTATYLCDFQLCLKFNREVLAHC